MTAKYSIADALSGRANAGFQTSSDARLLPLWPWARRRARRHLDEQQIRQLLDVVTIRHAVVAQHIAVVPEFLDDGRCVHTSVPKQECFQFLCSLLPFLIRDALQVMQLPLYGRQM